MKKIKALPREPLTKKRRAAIQTYVSAFRPSTVQQVVTRTLSAERMKAADLYLWLTNHGYAWRGGWWNRSLLINRFWVRVPGGSQRNCEGLSTR